MSAFSRLKALDEIKTAIELIRACVGMGKGQWFSQNRTFSLLSSNASLFCNPSYSLLTVCFILRQYPFLSFQVRIFKVHKYTYASFYQGMKSVFSFNGLHHLLETFVYYPYEYYNNFVCLCQPLHLHFMELMTENTTACNFMFLE